MSEQQQTSELTSDPIDYDDALVMMIIMSELIDHEYKAGTYKYSIGLPIVFQERYDEIQFDEKPIDFMLVDLGYQGAHPFGIIKINTILERDEDTTLIEINDIYFTASKAVKEVPSTVWRTWVRYRNDDETVVSQAPHGNFMTNPGVLMPCSPSYFSYMNSSGNEFGQLTQAQAEELYTIIDAIELD